MVKIALFEEKMGQEGRRREWMLELGRRSAEVRAREERRAAGLSSASSEWEPLCL